MGFLVHGDGATTPPMALLSDVAEVAKGDLLTVWRNVRRASKADRLLGANPAMASAVRA